MDEDKYICSDHDKIVALGVEISYLKAEIKRLEEDNDNFKKSTINRLDDLFDILSKSNPTLSSKDRATIIIAVIGSIASMTASVVIAIFNKMI